MHHALQHRPTPAALLPEDSDLNKTGEFSGQGSQFFPATSNPVEIEIGAAASPAMEKPGAQNDSNPVEIEAGVAVAAGQSKGSAAQPSAASSTVVFGPVNERVVPFAINFDTGGSLLSENRPVKWLEEQGFDARHQRDALLSMGMKLAAVKSDAWKTMNAPELVKMVETTPGNSQVEMKLNPSATEPSTYLFRTREGAMGIVQLMETADGRRRSIRGVRYKLVKRSSDASPSTEKAGAAAQVEPAWGQANAEGLQVSPEDLLLALELRIAIARLEQQPTQAMENERATLRKQEPSLYNVTFFVLLMQRQAMLQGEIERLRRISADDQALQGVQVQLDALADLLDRHGQEEAVKKARAFREEL